MCPSMFLGRNMEILPKKRSFLDKNSFIQIFQTNISLIHSTQRFFDASNTNFMVSKVSEYVLRSKHKNFFKTQKIIKRTKNHQPFFEYFEYFKLDFRYVLFGQTKTRRSYLSKRRRSYFHRNQRECSENTHRNLQQNLLPFLLTNLQQ